ncbi:MAG: VanZ family protein [Chloroflexi bacterium]|jgi:VanZ family protein|nr:VanZ family protein [Chloroflexota bacterium]
MFAFRSLFRWAPAVVMMGLIFIASSTPASQIPYFGAIDLLVKKGGHAIGYALLGLSYFFALPGRLSIPYRAVMALLMAVLFSLSDEFHQSFVEGRTSTVRDVLIDTGGATLALFAAAIYSSSSKSSSNSGS